MQTTTFSVHTGGRDSVHDITRQCEQFAGGRGEARTGC